MPRFVRLGLLATAALAPLSAYAAGASTAPVGAAPPFAAVDAPASPQSSSIGTGAKDQGEDIIVTARRRSETSQEVPLAISVVGGEHIDNTGSFNVGRLQQLTPTLQY